MNAKNFVFLTVLALSAFGLTLYACARWCFREGRDPFSHAVTAAQN